MGSFSDLFCLRSESLCGCGWDKFLISLWEPRSRIFEHVWWKLSQVPPLHMGLHKRGRAFEPWEKNNDTSSINLWCSILSPQTLQRPHLVFSHSPHPTGQSPWGKSLVWPQKHKAFHPTTVLQLKTIALFASSRHRLVLCLFYSTKTSRNGCLILNSKPTLTIHMMLLIFESRLLLVSTETQSTLVNYEALQWDFRSWYSETQFCFQGAPWTII